MIQKRRLALIPTEKALPVASTYYASPAWAMIRTFTHALLLDKWAHLGDNKHSANFATV